MLNFPLIMNQPELGKKIAELRKSKGLTQEDLVSKCNLNIRTLQRIESGVVTPRSYTIKMLFTALDYQVCNYSESKTKKRVPAFLRENTEHLYKHVFDLFNLKTNTMKKISILSTMAIFLSICLFFLCSESKAQKTKEFKFVSSNGRGIIYQFPRGSSIYISNVKDTADYKIGKYLIQEFKYKIFLNDKYVGKVLEGDTVVLNKGKITIRKSYWENNSDIGSGIVYLFPKNMTVRSRGYYKDTVTWVLEDFYIKEFKNKIFLNDKYFETANAGDTLIFKNGTLSFKNSR